MSEKEVMDQKSKSNFNSPSGPDCLATKQLIIKKFLLSIINLDLKEMLKSLGQILLSVTLVQTKSNLLKAMKLL